MSSNIWSPAPKSIDNSYILEFIILLNNKYNINIKNYDELHAWSIDNINSFWSELLAFSHIAYEGKYREAVDDEYKMPGARWFKGLSINYAENLLRKNNKDIAIEFHSENGSKTETSYFELNKQASSVSNYLVKLGVKPGDRVAAVVSNIPESVIFMLGCASVGAVWTSCSPDFGEQAIIDRFEQVNPKILVVVDGYKFKGKYYSIFNKICSISEKINSIKEIVLIDFIKQVDPNSLELPSISFSKIISENYEEIIFNRLPFNHPLFIMYSSGTTGKPKSIVHSAGGTLIQHIKELMLHVDLKKNEKIFYFTTCGWMMWNWLVSSLYFGSTIVLFDGSPFYPDGSNLLKIADKSSINIFGTSAKYIDSLEKTNILPSEYGEYKNLRTILSTGSPLHESNFNFIYKEWKKDIQISSISGGTDIISCFALGSPILPVYKGRLQCIGLGMDVHSYNENGESVLDKKGELICKKAFPSMPISFWNDESGAIYRKTYFSEYKNTWTHGDYITIYSEGGVEIHGRSDSTLNPGGVRIGTAEIYKVVDQIDSIDDSLAIGLEIENDEQIILFVKMKGDLTKELCRDIKNKIKNICSPRHAPYRIIKVPDIPYTLNGKKIEIAVKKILNKEKVQNLSSMANPESLKFFKKINI